MVVPVNQRCVVEVLFRARPRDYRIELPTKMKRLALCSTLSDRLRNQRLFGLAGLKIEQAKTKQVTEVLTQIHPEKKKHLLLPGA